MGDPAKAPFYHGTIKQIIGGFGALFSNMRIERKKVDTIKGETVQTIKVPLSYGPHEKWMTALNADPTKSNQVNIIFPRIAYEMVGLTYDSSRKSTRSSTIGCSVLNKDGTAGRSTVLSPAPWNIELALYIVGNKTEDVLQILEQILPYFNPDYSIKLKAIPGMNIINTVPITLNSVSIQDDYSGDLISQRLIVYTLNFNAKANMYGFVSDSIAIRQIEVGTGDGTDIITPDFTALENGDLEYDGTVTMYHSDTVTDEYYNTDWNNSTLTGVGVRDVHVASKQHMIDGKYVEYRKDEETEISAHDALLESLRKTI